MSILGLDIGGANIKAADENGKALSQPFAIWNRRGELKDRLVEILGVFPDTHQIALTMTGELADCFATKDEGVCWILDATENAFREVFADRQQNDAVRVWSTDGTFLALDEARKCTLKVAASNWHALASWVGRMATNGPSALIDIGTTTSDIIPLLDGVPSSVGRTDVGRLLNGELVYCGVWRTPLCAVTTTVPFRNGNCPIAAELFATTLDVYLLLDKIPEDASNRETANGKPATKSNAHDRIARLLCCDRSEISLEEAVTIARYLDHVTRTRLSEALDRVIRRLPSPCRTVFVSGSGDFLARELALECRSLKNVKIVSLKDRYSAEVADAACAHALAQLAASQSD